MCIRVEQDDAAPQEFSFTKPVQIGRGVECELQINSGLVSRHHAELVYEEGTWWIRDLGSTNGMYVEGEKVQQVRLAGPVAVKLGHQGPTLHVTLTEAGPPDQSPPPAGQPAEKERAAQRRSTFHAARTQRSVSPDSKKTSEKEAAPEAPSPPATSRSAGTSSGAPDASLSQVIERYFDDDPSRPAGEHTMMIRRAYAAVKEKEKRKYTGVILAVVALLLLAIGFIGYQEIRIRQLRGQAAEVFTDVKQIELDAAALRYELREDEELAERLAGIERRRIQQRKAYEGYVKELGLYRKLSDEEQLIYRVARIFNESEFEMPAGFVREVRETIRDYWLTSAGRGRFERAIERAEENGYTPYIVETMRRYGLPPEFFYLSLQESNLDPTVYGIRTRWGIAKGMWQFIPSTARQYGLRIGPREDVRVTDPQDDRHDFRKSTEAAAKYLLYIYSTPAQASGLLVMASYNWGEHRVISKLQHLSTPEDVFAVAFEGIPQDPDARNYWRFLTEYQDRMPEETKDYVLKIFSAAVIGQDPRRYGFDFDNPLKPYMETPLTQTE